MAGLQNSRGSNEENLERALPELMEFNSTPNRCHGGRSQMRPSTTFVLRNLRRPQDDVITVHYNRIKPDRVTVPSDTRFADPPPATRFYEAPSGGVEITMYDVNGFCFLSIEM